LYITPIANLLRTFDFSFVPYYFQTSDLFRVLFTITFSPRAKHSPLLRGNYTAHRCISSRF
jgi:hypothetical protein